MKKMEKNILADQVQYTHQNAPTRFIEAAGVRFAYRRFGNKGNIPLIFNIHFRGNMDHWDPLITDGFAKEREVIIFDNAGVGSTTGQPPSSIYEMAGYAEAFVDALNLKQVDLLGFSMGGLVAQQFTLDRPELVRKLILVGTGPRGGENMQTATPESKAVFGGTYEKEEDMWIRAFFTSSAQSSASAKAFAERYQLRQEDRDLSPGPAVGRSQWAALASYNVIREDRYSDLKKIQQPVLVINGDSDVIIYTINSYILQQHLPDATLVLFSDSGHGSLYQYPKEFLNYANSFLNQ